jgi:biopolymer transport protein ExbD
LETWDVFHSDRLEVERGLSTSEVRAAVARGDLREDDLIRPAGATSGWTPLADMPALLAPEVGEEAGFGADVEPDAEAGPVPVPAQPAPDDDDDGGPYGEFDLSLRGAGEGNGEGSSTHEIIVWDDDLEPAPEEQEYDPQDEDEDAAEFTLSRGAADHVEELDLAAMVDVAFQLVLFFLVTATTVLYKSLEVPKPNPQNDPAAAAAQGRSKTPDDLKDVYILVDIDPGGGMKIDREPVAAELPALAERLRQARERTGRTSMLLTADFSTPHRSAVLAYDAANEIGLAIAITRPAPPGQNQNQNQGQAPNPAPAAPDGA